MPLKRKKKPTGELELFKKIYDQRGPYCEECGKYVEFDPSIFSHRHSKGAHPGLRLDPDNIDVLCWDHHQQWEFGKKRKEMKIYNNGRKIPL